MSQSVHQSTKCCRSHGGKEKKAAFVCVLSEKRRLGRTKEGPDKRGVPLSPLFQLLGSHSRPCISGNGRHMLHLRCSDWLVGAATFRSLGSYDGTKYSSFHLKRSLPEASQQWPAFSDLASSLAEPLCRLSAGTPRLTKSFHSGFVFTSFGTPLSFVLTG